MGWHLQVSEPQTMHHYSNVAYPKIHWNTYSTEQETHMKYEGIDQFALISPRGKISTSVVVHYFVTPHFILVIDLLILPL